MLIDHLLDAKRKHDEDKNVEKEEVEHLDKGTDYLVSFLVGQGIQVSQPKKATKQKPPGLEELKKKFVENLVNEGYVTVNDAGRTVLTENGKKFLDSKTKSADTKVTIAKLKNLQLRNVFYIQEELMQQHQFKKSSNYLLQKKCCDESSLEP